MIAATPDTALAFLARESCPVDAPGYDCCGCTTGASVPTVDGLCPDCAPRHALAAKHATACRCTECLWYVEVETRRMTRSLGAEATEFVAIAMVGLHGARTYDPRGERLRALATDTDARLAAGPRCACGAVTGSDDHVCLFCRVEAGL